MNLDKYNDAIKRKLESIEPRFEENDWDEMKSFMALNAPKGSLWSRYGRLFLYSTGAILLLSSLFFNIKQNYDNKSLLKINELLIQKIDAKQAVKTQIVYQTDTVYLIKYITKWRTIDNTIAQNNLEEKNITTDNQPFTLKDVNINKQIKAIGSNPIRQNQTNKNEITTGKLDDEDKKKTNKDLKNIQSINQVVNQIFEPNTITENVSRKENDDLISEKKIQNLSELNSIPFNPNAYLWTKQNLKINFITKMPIDALAQRKHIIIKLPSISLANLK